MTRMNWEDGLRVLLEMDSWYILRKIYEHWYGKTDFVFSFFLRVRRADA